MYTITIDSNYDGLYFDNLFSFLLDFNYNQRVLYLLKYIHLNSINDYTSVFHFFIYFQLLSDNILMSVDLKRT